MFSEFKDATKKDQKSKKEKYDNRIKFFKRNETTEERQSFSNERYINQSKTI